MNILKVEKSENDPSTNAKQAQTTTV